MDQHLTGVPSPEHSTRARTERIGDRLYLDRTAGRVYWNGHEQALDHLHVALLIVFVDHPNVIYDLPGVTHAVWGGIPVSAETVRRRLRQIRSLPPLAASLIHTRGGWVWTP